MRLAVGQASKLSPYQNGKPVEQTVSLRIAGDIRLQEGTDRNVYPTA